MKKSWMFYFSVGLVFMACGGKTEEKKSDEVLFQLAPLAGMYMDTIPAPGAIGNVVQVTIHADSTFSMFERVMKIDDPVIRPLSTTGDIEILENGKRLKLKPKNTGAKAMWIECGPTEIVLLDSLGNRHASPGNYRLERMSAAVSQIGNDRLFSIDKGQLRFPLGVYSRPGGGNINVSSFYLNGCAEAELGLCYTYSMAFRGKLEGKDPLALVLKKDGNVLRAIADRTVLNKDGGALTLSERQEILTSLVVSKTAESYTVTYTYLDAKDENWMVKDEFQFKDGKMVLTQLGEVQPLNR